MSCTLSTCCKRIWMNECVVGWLVESLTSHSTHYRSYQRRSSQSITWQVQAKLNRTTTSNSKTQKTSKKLRTQKLNQMQIKPGLGASYTIRPRNGVGLFYSSRNRTGRINVASLWQMARLSWPRYLPSIRRQHVCKTCFWGSWSTHSDQL